MHNDEEEAESPALGVWSSVLMLPVEKRLKGCAPLEVCRQSCILRQASVFRFLLCLRSQARRSIITCTPNDPQLSLRDVVDAQLAVCRASHSAQPANNCATRRDSPIHRIITQSPMCLILGK